MQHIGLVMSLQYILADRDCATVLTV